MAARSRSQANINKFLKDPGHLHSFQTSTHPYTALERTVLTGWISNSFTSANAYVCTLPPLHFVLQRDDLDRTRVGRIMMAKRDQR
jgi:hypothetical protein